MSAGMTTAEVFLDTQQNPIGTRPGENFQVASNYRIAPFDVFLVNHSREHAWRKCVVPVSSRGGAEELIEYRDKKNKTGKKGEIYSVDMVYRQAEKRDMSEYETGLYLVTAAVKIAGMEYFIPPAEEGGEPEPQEVKEGVWDLYVGNYERMRSSDPTVVAKEREHLSLIWLRKKNPVFRETIDGVSRDTGNPYGFLEIVRTTRKTAPQILDKSFITASQLMEV